jgi:hypothetical protein
MVLGVLTENGIRMNSAPLVERSDQRSIFFFLQSTENPNVRDIIKLSKKLKAFDNLSGRKAWKIVNDKQMVLQ